MLVVPPSANNYTSTVHITAQPAGQPEVCKRSLTEGPATGGQELFIIGKNFMKGTKVHFQEVQEDKVLWSQDADIDPEYFQPVCICVKLNQSCMNFDSNLKPWVQIAA